MIKKSDWTEVQDTVNYSDVPKDKPIFIKPVESFCKSPLAVYPYWFNGLFSWRSVEGYQFGSNKGASFNAFTNYIEFEE